MSLHAARMAMAMGLAIGGWSFGQAQAQVISSITVKAPETKADGNYWDFGLGRILLPDMEICAGLPGQAATCSPECSDQPVCTLTFDSGGLETNGVIALRVRDMDLSQHDTVFLSNKVPVGARSKQVMLPVYGGSQPTVSVAFKIAAAAPKPKQEQPGCMTVDFLSPDQNLPPGFIQATGIIRRHARQTAERYNAFIARGGVIQFCAGAKYAGGYTLADDRIRFGEPYRNRTAEATALALIHELGHAAQPLVGGMNPQIFAKADARFTSPMVPTSYSSALLNHEAHVFVMQLKERDAILASGGPLIPPMPPGSMGSALSTLENLWKTMKSSRLSEAQMIAELRSLAESMTMSDNGTPKQYNRYYEEFASDLLACAHRTGATVSKARGHYICE